MPRPVHAESEAINADSFLDIVASVVSIMIVMVLVVGLRIKNTPVELSLPASPANVANDLAADLAAEQSMRKDVWETAAEVRRLHAETAMRGRQRDTLALAVALMEHKAERGRRPQARRPRIAPCATTCRRPGCNWRS